MGAHHRADERVRASEATAALMKPGDHDLYSVLPLYRLRDPARCPEIDRRGRHLRTITQRRGRWAVVFRWAEQAAGDWVLAFSTTTWKLAWQLWWVVARSVAAGKLPGGYKVLAVYQGTKWRRRRHHLLVSKDGPPPQGAERQHARAGWTVPPSGARRWERMQADRELHAGLHGEAQGLALGVAVQWITADGIRWRSAYPGEFVCGMTGE